MHPLFVTARIPLDEITRLDAGFPYASLWRALRYSLCARAKAVTQLPSCPFRDDHVVSWHRQKFGEGRRLDQLGEQPRGVFVAAAVTGVAPSCELIVEQFVAQRRIDGAAAFELGAASDPLPKLGAADLRRCSILHQMTEWCAARAAQPGLDIADPDIDVLAQTGLGDRALGHREKVRRGDMDVLALAGDLVRPGHLMVEDLLRDRDEPRMRDPSAVMPAAGFALFVGTHLLHRRLVGFRVVADRDLCRHAAHRMDLAAMTGLDQQKAIAAQKVGGHRD